MNYLGLILIHTNQGFFFKLKMPFNKHLLIQNFFNERVTNKSFIKGDFFLSLELQKNFLTRAAQ